MMHPRHALVGSHHVAAMKRAFQIGFLKGVGLLPDHQMLDFGCGTLRGGIPIIDYLEPGHYTGIEARPAVLAQARDELKEARLLHKRPILIVGDRIQTGLTYDVIWLFSVVIHLTDERLHDVLSDIRAHMGAGGACYANANVEPIDGDRWQGFPVVTRPVAFYEAACAEAGLALQDMGPLRLLGHLSGRKDDAQHMFKMTYVAD